MHMHIHAYTLTHTFAHSHINTYTYSPLCSCEMAVRTFSGARPPGIYKEDYLTELARRYNDGDIEGMEAPEKPDWYFMDLGEGKEEVDDDGLPVGKGKGRKDKPRRKERAIDDNKRFAVEIADVSRVPSPRMEDVQRMCQEICGWDG